MFDIVFSSCAPHFLQCTTLDGSWTISRDAERDVILPSQQAVFAAAKRSRRPSVAESELILSLQVTWAAGNVFFVTCKLNFRLLESSCSLSFRSVVC